MQIGQTYKNKITGQILKVTEIDELDNVWFRDLNSSDFFNMDLYLAEQLMQECITGDRTIVTGDRSIVGQQDSIDLELEIWGLWKELPRNRQLELLEAMCHLTFHALLTDIRRMDRRLQKPEAS